MNPNANQETLWNDEKDVKALKRNLPTVISLDFSYKLLPSSE